MFVSRDESLLIAHFGVLISILIQGPQKTTSQSNSPAKKFKCSIETLTGKLGQVVTEKYKIEYGDESKMLAHVDPSRF